jgi:hypothetical protein
MPQPGRELFVYYRVATMHADAARLEVRRFQADLCVRHRALQARLLRRPGEVVDVQTWMEVYALPQEPGGVSEALQAEIEHAADRLMPLIDGPRHCEVFQRL